MTMEFKVGDWVLDLYGKCIQLDESHFKGVTARTPAWFNELTPWQPKVGEWCWNSHILVRVTYINSEKREDGLPIYGMEVPMMGETWVGASTLEPFIGTLPSFIKKQ